MPMIQHTRFKDESLSTWHFDYKIHVTKFALNENDIKDTKEMKQGELKILRHNALLELEERQGENINWMIFFPIY